MYKQAMFDLLFAISLFLTWDLLRDHDHWSCSGIGNYDPRITSQVKSKKSATSVLIRCITKEAKEKYRGMFETQKSGNKISSGEIGLDIRTHVSPKVDRTRCPEE